jgi:hypothetical protein
VRGDGVAAQIVAASGGAANEGDAARAANPDAGQGPAGQAVAGAAELAELLQQNRAIGQHLMSEHQLQRAREEQQQAKEAQQQQMNQAMIEALRSLQTSLAPAGGGAPPSHVPAPPGPPPPSQAAQGAPGAQGIAPVAAGAAPRFAIRRCGFHANNRWHSLDDDQTQVPEVSRPELKHCSPGEQLEATRLYRLISSLEDMRLHILDFLADPDLTPEQGLGAADELWLLGSTENAEEGHLLGPLAIALNRFAVLLTPQNRRAEVETVIAGKEGKLSLLELCRSDISALQTSANERALTTLMRNFAGSRSKEQEEDNLAAEAKRVREAQYRAQQAARGGAGGGQGARGGGRGGGAGRGRGGATQGGRGGGGAPAYHA